MICIDKYTGGGFYSGKGTNLIIVYKSLSKNKYSIRLKYSFLFKQLSNFIMKRNNV